MTSYIPNIFIPILLAIIVWVYVYVYYKNSNNTKNYKIKYLPDGYIVGIIWLIIFGFLGYSTYILKNNISSYLIILTLLYCLSYPFLTINLNIKESYKYNVIAFIIASFTYLFVFFENKYASTFIIPLLIWSSYVVIIT